jgi:hypothetical protein
MPTRRYEASDASRGRCRRGRCQRGRCQRGRCQRGRCQRGRCQPGAIQSAPQSRARNRIVEQTSRTGLSRVQGAARSGTMGPGTEQPGIAYPGIVELPGRSRPSRTRRRSRLTTVRDGPPHARGLTVRALSADAAPSIGLRAEDGSEIAAEDSSRRGRPDSAGMPTPAISKSLTRYDRRPKIEIASWTRFVTDRKPSGIKRRPPHAIWAALDRWGHRPIRRLWLPFEQMAHWSAPYGLELI